MPIKWTWLPFFHTQEHIILLFSGAQLGIFKGMGSIHGKEHTKTFKKMRPLKEDTTFQISSIQSLLVLIAVSFHSSEGNMGNNEVPGKFLGPNLFRDGKLPFLVESVLQ